MNPQGTALAYAGYIGGSGTESSTGIAVDMSGSAYITGYTDSDPSSFPETVGPVLTYGGLDDAFVAKVNPQGTALAYAGYIGGSGSEIGSGIAVDASGAAYITGGTDSGPASFPETVGPFLTYAGGSADAFVAKVNPQGTALAYAGYIGGANLDAGSGIAVDASGAAYLTGYTNSGPASFPETVGPFLTYGGGLLDAFVAKVNPQGAALAYAGYIGGAGGDGGSDIAVDASGAAYITGYTDSDAGSFPETVGPSLVYSGGRDAFVAKITDNLCQGAGVTIQGTQGHDTIIGTAGADVIQALGGNDRIDAAGGSDVVCAGDGNDRVTGGTGDDRIDGEAGTDTASFAGTVGVIVDLVLGTATGLGTDTLANIENVSGSSKKDLLRGSSVSNVIRGLGGKDRLVARAGKDRLIGGAANDRLAGGGGNDRLAGGKGDDRMNGGKGRNDRCNGGAGDRDAASASCEKVTGVP